MYSQQISVLPCDLELLACSNLFYPEVRYWVAERASDTDQLLVYVSSTQHQHVRVVVDAGSSEPNSRLTFDRPKEKATLKQKVRIC